MCAAPSLSRLVRLVRASFRIHDTAALYLDTGNGITAVPLQVLPNGVLDSPPARQSRDVIVRSIGWKRDGVTPLWRIEQWVPLPCTILSVSTEQRITD